MAGRSGRRRVDPSSPLVDLDVVFADDTLVDAIAAAPWGEQEHYPFVGAAGRTGAGSVGAGSVGAGSRGSQLTVDPLTELLQSWRAELAVAPIPAPPSSVEVPVQAQGKPAVKRSFRSALAVAAAIAALLVGSASIGSKDATPDSALWMVTEVLWPNRAQSIESVGHVKAALREAQFALDDGRPQDAQIALLRATVELGKVEDVDGRSDMQQSVVSLWAQVGPTNLPASTLPAEFATAGPSSAATRSAATVATDPRTAPSATVAVQVADPGSVQVSIAPPSSTPPALNPAPQPVDPARSSARVTSPPATAGSSSAPASSSVPSIGPPAEVAAAPVTPVDSSAPSTPQRPTVTDAGATTEGNLPSATEQSPPAPTPSTTPLSVGSTDPTVADPLSLNSPAAASGAITDAAE